MNVSLKVQMSNGMTQTIGVDLPDGVTVTGYTVDVNGFPVVSPAPVDLVDRITRNATYGKRRNVVPFPYPKLGPSEFLYLTRDREHCGSAYCGVCNPPAWPPRRTP